MNTIQRIAVVAKAFAGRSDLGFNSESDLRQLLEVELGSPEILDQPLARGKIYLQARAPASIYHICASTLSVSAETSLLLGLLLGSRLEFKLPSAGLPEFEKTVAALPPLLRDHVVLLSQHDPERLKNADAVVVFGSDATVEEIRRQLHWRQKFLAYSHKVSLGWITAADISPGLADLAAQEVLAYGQLGCLSPQAYLCDGDAAVFAAILARSLGQQTKPVNADTPDFARATLRRDWIQRAQARGDSVFEDETCTWAVILADSGTWDFGPGGGCINVVPNPDLTALARLQGQLSSVSSSSLPLPEGIRNELLKAGVQRFCPVGQLQQPDLLWHHDGRPRLSDLVTWITFEK